MFRHPYKIEKEDSMPYAVAFAADPNTLAKDVNEFLSSHEDYVLLGGVSIASGIINSPNGPINAIHFSQALVTKDLLRKD